MVRLHYGPAKWTKGRKEIRLTDSVFTPNSDRYMSKKSLIEAVKAGEMPILESTSFFGDGQNLPFNELKPGRYYIVGPGPYMRKWYAEVEIRRDGTIKVS